MTSIEGFEGHIERVDDLPLLFGLLQQMGVQSILDSGIQPHGNWQGLSPGWVVTVWLMHILGAKNHLTVTRNEAAIAAAEFQAGWRIYATNAPVDKLSLAQAVLAYREQYIEENIFRRLQGKLLSITPLYIQRDDHAEGLFHLV